MLLLAEMTLLLMALAFAGYLIWKSICRAYPCPAAPLSVEQKAAAEVREKKEKLQAAITNISLLASQESKLDEQIAEAQRQAGKWKQVEAATASKEDLREVIRNRMEAERREEIYVKAREELRETLAGLRSQINAAQDKVESTDSDLSILSARLKAAKAREEISGDLKAVADLQEEVDRAEGRASANEEIDQFAKPKMTTELDVEAELEQVMASRKT
jgi:phage shock protein A